MKWRFRCPPAGGDGCWTLPTTAPKRSSSLTACGLRARSVSLFVAEDTE